MKNQGLKTIIFLIAGLFSCLFTHAQETGGKLSVYFESGKYAISQTHLKQLDSLAQVLQQYPHYDIQLLGRADVKGEEAANLALSENRVQAVQRALEKQGLKVASTHFLGEKSPIRKGLRPEDLAINRSVEIFVSHRDSPEKQDAAPIADNDTTTIDDLLAKLRKPDQIFCINVQRDTILRCNDGTVLSVPAGSLQLLRNANDPCARLRVREAYRTSDQILNRLNTHSDGELLSTAGMVFVQAEDDEGKPMPLAPNKEIAIFVPVPALTSGYALFNGDRKTPSDMLNWHFTQTAQPIAQVAAKQMWCDNFITFERCRFFFCGLKNFVRKAFPPKKIKQNPKTKTALDMNEDGCERFAALAKKYNIKNINALREALYKNLVVQEGYQSFYEMVQKMSPEKLEAAIANYRDEMQVNPEMQFNAFSSPYSGWHNIDRYLKYPQYKVTKVFVNLKADSHTRCVVVVPKDQVLAEAQAIAGKWTFPVLPKNKKAVLIVMQYFNGKAFLYKKDLTIAAGPWAVDLQEVSAAQLEEELEKLDRNKS